jgi:hypothetical protein
MNCPHCGAPLEEKESNRKWQRFFSCGECWLPFELVPAEANKTRKYALCHFRYMFVLTVVVP